MTAQANEPESPAAAPTARTYEPQRPQNRSTGHQRSTTHTDLLERAPLPQIDDTAPPERRRGPRGPRETNPRPGHIHGLDGLRALAVLGVLVFHFTPTVLPGGFLGVDVFFVLSGFLITTLLLREITTRGRVNLLSFWVRRARRLIPALVTVVVVSIAAARLVGGDLLVNIGRQTLGAMTFSTNWVEVAAGASYFHSTSPLLFVNFWSLAVEEQFYLLWPLTLVILLAVTRTARHRIGFAVALALVSALLMAVRYDPQLDSTRVYYGTDTHLFGLMLGVGLAFAWAAPHRAGLTTATWRRWRPWAVSGALLVLVGLMKLLTDGNPWTFRGGILLACLATVVLIAGLLESPSLWRRLMQLPPLAYLGERSYGIYLWHWPVLMIVATLFPYAEGTTRGKVTLGAALVLTLVLSELSHRFIETPIRRHGFRATLARARETVRGAGRGELPQIAAVTVGVLVLLAGVAIATAPDKSETQRAIEAAEGDLNSPGTDAVARRSAMSGTLVGTPAPPAASGAEGSGTGGAQGSDSGEGTSEDAATGGDSAADGFADALGGGKDPATGGDPKGEDAGSEDGAGPGEEADGTGAGAAATPPEGWFVDDDGLMVPHSNTITAIGDSLVVTSADGLKWRFPDMNFSAKSNRQWKDANPVLESALAEGLVRDNVIVHFGTNAGVNEDQLRAFLDQLGPDRKVVVMNLYGSSTFVPGSNATIDKVVQDYPNAVVGDWQGTIERQPKVLQSDRIHPDLEGMHVYAEVVARAFDELARR
ncbi:acyltransferase family protein [Ornithinimicrobium cavernae]|uniref:acyltransferase family protein n=1 Tax=Ornithinimicrobium cavernae TaxID=2666047 RepID=UPI0012B1640D|nr:acyltransferase family protein [Ornithinimicrobium cavernae]